MPQSKITVTSVNLDLIPVSFHPDFTMVTYESGTGTRGGSLKSSCRLRKFLEMFPTSDVRPEHTKKPFPIQENILCVIHHYGITIKFNTITDRPDLFRDGKRWDTLQNCLQEIWDLCEKQFFVIPKERLESLLVSLSRKNKYNPIKEYLINSHEKWDGESRLQQLCNTLTSDFSDREDYVKRFLVQMVALAVCKDEDSTAGQFALVLQGRQGKGKTTWFQNLLPKHLQSDYFLGGRSLDPNNKDHVIESASNWLVEMGEISSTFKKADQELLKAYITSVKDRVRVPYGKEAIDKKRRTSLCGTTNDDEYLRDDTGSRRFLTITCTKINYNHDIDIDQLWGEVYQIYLDGFVWWFTPEEAEIITQRNEQYRVKSDVQLQIELYFDLFPDKLKDDWFCLTNDEASGEFLTSKEIADYIDMKKCNSDDRLSSVKIGKALKSIGVRSEESRSRTIRFYVSKLDLDTNDYDQLPL